MEGIECWRVIDRIDGDDEGTADGFVVCCGCQIMVWSAIGQSDRNCGSAEGIGHWREMECACGVRGVVINLRVMDQIGIVTLYGDLERIIFLAAGSDSIQVDGGIRGVFIDGDVIDFIECGNGIVGVPGDGVVVMRGGEDIEIAIPIDVGDGHRAGATRILGNDVACKSLCAIVLIPGDGVIVGGRRDQVGVTIPVEIGGNDFAGPQGFSCDRVRYKGRFFIFCSCVVLKPPDSVVVSGRSNDIGVTIAIQVCGEDATGTEGRFTDCVGRERLTAVVGVPVN